MRIRQRFHTLAAASATAFLLAGAATTASAQDVVLAFGDSITHGLGDGSVTCDGAPGGYPPRLRSTLGTQGTPITTRNYGLCGERTSSGVSRIDAVLADNPDADVILIMEGTNDLSSNAISTQSMRFNLNQMVDKAEAAGLEPVLASPVPRAPEAGSNERTGFLTALIQQDAAAQDIVFANPYAALVDIPDLYETYYSDPFHPNASGYDLLANVFVDPAREALERAQPGPCQVGVETLCLSNNRFRVEVDWAASGETGQGQAVPLSGDTGFFWFFSSDNLELVVKVLDGRGINGHFWVFYGALSDVEYRIAVTDSVTGERKIYDNPEGTQASFGDTQAFAEAAPDGAVPRGAVVAGPVGSPPESSWRGGLIPLPAAAGPRKADCKSAPEILCLRQDRFAVEIDWQDFSGATGTGRAVNLSDETGYFWFFDGDNVEVVIKVLDGRTFNDHYWVFYGSLSDVAYDIAVTDTTSGAVVHYVNPLGSFGSDSDVEAFPGS